jgi:hypothetical protein
MNFLKNNMFHLFCYQLIEGILHERNAAVNYEVAHAKVTHL